MNTRDVSCGLKTELFAVLHRPRALSDFLPASEYRNLIFVYTPDPVPGRISAAILSLRQPSLPRQISAFRTPVARHFLALQLASFGCQAWLNPLNIRTPFLGLL